MEIPISGVGVSPFGDIQVDVANNNLGGLKLSDTPRTVTQFATVRNIGAAPLAISNIVASPLGVGQFSVGGLPAGLRTVQSHRDQSRELLQRSTSRFDANLVGLQRGEIQISSDDPDTPVFHPSPWWARAADTRHGAGLRARFRGGRDARGRRVAPVLRQISDDRGELERLPAVPRRPSTRVIFDPVSGLIAHSFDVTRGQRQDAPRRTRVPGQHRRRTPTATVCRTTSSSPSALRLRKVDTDGDGISDFAAIEQGLPPLGGRSFPTGVIAGVTLRGGANDVVVDVSPDNSQRETAYVATDAGLAMVDVSQFDKPIVLSQLDVPGSTAVAVDTSTKVAVVSHGRQVSLVNISDSLNPVVLRNLDIPGGAGRVVAFDGLAYVTSGRAAAQFRSGYRRPIADPGPGRRDADRCGPRGADALHHGYQSQSCAPWISAVRTWWPAARSRCPTAAAGSSWVTASRMPRR